jgi:hypothetical protein
MNRMLFFLFASIIGQGQSIVVPIRRFHSRQNGGGGSGGLLSERNLHRLSKILDQDTISITDKDYNHFQPPYLFEFCKNIRRTMKDRGDELPDQSTLDDLALQYKDQFYTESNFPYTYRPEHPVKITAEQLQYYRRQYCGYYNSEDKVFCALVFVSIIMVIVVLFVI